MNLYVLVEGAKTEVNVYPAWMQLLVPKLTRVYDFRDAAMDNYYLFSGGGIPHIYSHLMHAIEDVNTLNAKAGKVVYDYLLVSMDTENVDRATILNRISNDMKTNGFSLNGTQLVVCEHQVCMESWFLGNRLIFKSNPQNQQLIDCIRYYNVSVNDPELMGSNDPELNGAQYHYRYLQEMFKERHMRYSKSNTKEVEKPAYLQQLIDRYNDTGHLATFGNWYRFITSL